MTRQATQTPRCACGREVVIHSAGTCADPEANHARDRGDVAMTDGPSVHHFGRVRPGEWDVPFTGFTMLRATDFDGREHIFHVPSAALAAAPLPSDTPAVHAITHSDPSQCGGECMPGGKP